MRHICESDVDSWLTGTPATVLPAITFAEAVRLARPTAETTEVVGYLGWYVTVSPQVEHRLCWVIIRNGVTMCPSFGPPRPAEEATLLDAQTGEHYHSHAISSEQGGEGRKSGSPRKLCSGGYGSGIGREERGSVAAEAAP